jgi:hypothetical protein
MITAEQHFWTAILQGIRYATLPFIQNSDFHREKVLSESRVVPWAPGAVHLFQATVHESLHEHIKVDACLGSSKKL